MAGVSVSPLVLCQWSPATHFTFYPDCITGNNNQYHQNHHRLCKHATPHRPASPVTTSQGAVSPWHITASSSPHHITIVTLSALHHPICHDSCGHNCWCGGSEVRDPTECRDSTQRSVSILHLHTLVPPATPPPYLAIPYVDSGLLPKNCSYVLVVYPQIPRTFHKNLGPYA